MELQERFRALEQSVKIGEKRSADEGDAFEVGRRAPARKRAKTSRGRKLFALFPVLFTQSF